MNLPGNHVGLMFIYAVATGVFFSFLWRKSTKDRIRLFLLIFVSLFVGGIVLAWIMLPFPLK